MIVAYLLPPEMMHLSQAAAIARERLFRSMVDMSQDTLDAIATALSARLTIFGIREAGTGLVQLAKEDYSSGIFRCGATRVDIGNRSISGLAVRKSDFARLLDWLLSLSLFRTSLTM